MSMKEIIKSCARTIYEEKNTGTLILATQSGFIKGRPLFSDETFETNSEKALEKSLSRVTEWKHPNNPDEICGDEDVFVLYDAYLIMRIDDSQSRQHFSSLVVRYDSIVGCTIDTF